MRSQDLQNEDTNDVEGGQENEEFVAGVEDEDQDEDEDEDEDEDGDGSMLKLFLRVVINYY